MVLFLFVNCDYTPWISILPAFGATCLFIFFQLHSGPDCQKMIIHDLVNFRNLGWNLIYGFVLESKLLVGDCIANRISCIIFLIIRISSCSLSNEIFIFHAS